MTDVPSQAAVSPDLMAIIQKAYLANRHYCVGFMGLGGDGSHTRSLGSGTLIDFEGVRGVVTAAHVAAHLQTVREFGVLRFRSTNFESLVCRERIDVVAIGGESEGELGPDIAFIRLPHQIESALYATNIFLSAVRRAEWLLNSKEVETAPFEFFAIGVLGEASHPVESQFSRLTATHHEAIIGMGDIQDYIQHTNGHDTFRFILDPRPGRPKVQSYGGVSGGGIWRLTYDDFGAVSRTLVGVPFRQTAADSEGNRELICHGAETVFGRLWAGVASTFVR